MSWTYLWEDTARDDVVSEYACGFWLLKWAENRSLVALIRGLRGAMSTDQVSK